MMKSSALIAVSMAILLASCESQPASQENEVEEFASRINAATPAATEDAAQTTETRQDPQAEGSPSDEQAEAAAGNCGAPKVAPFYGRPANEETRDAVLAALAPQKTVRFIDPGMAITPKPEATRLNVLLDAEGIIRDAVCG